MSKKMYDETYINNIALALQTIYGTSDKYYVSQMADAVLNVGVLVDKVIDNSIVNLKTAVTEIPAYKFYQAANIESLDAPNVSKIGPHALQETTKLASVNFPNLETVDTYALYKATGLTSLNLPKCKRINTWGLGYITDALGDTHLSTIKLSNSAIGENESFIMEESALAENTGAIMSADSRLRWLDVDDYHFIGLVDAVPPLQGPTVTVHDSVLYGDDTARTFDCEEGYIIALSTTGYPLVFKNGEWRAYVPEKSIIHAGANCYHSTRIRDVGFRVKQFTNNVNPFNKSRLAFIVVDHDCNLNANLPLFSSMPDLLGVFYDGGNNTLSDELPFTELGGAFYQCGNLKHINLPNLTKCTDGTFRDSGLVNLTLPKLTTFGKNSNYQGCGGCSNLVYTHLGDGTGTLFIVGSGHFQNCSSMYELKLDYTSKVTIDTATNASQIFSGCPIYQFLGTTTTEIIEGASAGSVVIDGTTVTTTNGNIVSYNGEDYKRVSNKWQKWGNAQDKHPVIYVPSDQIAAYKADAKWAVLSAEIWQAIS